VSAGQGIDVGAVAQAVLDGVVAHFAASEVTLPERRVIAAGDPRGVAWDCDQLVVTCGGIGWGAGPGTGSATARPTGNPISTAGARHTAIAVQIVRAVPVGGEDGPPPAADVTAAGLALMRDGGLLSQALTELIGRDGALGRAGAGLVGVEVLGPGGGMAAVEGILTATLAGLR
jgi:hypothetical protein